MRIDWQSKEKLIIKYNNEITIKEMAKRLNVKYTTLYSKILKMRKEGRLPPAEPRKSKMNSTKRKIPELDENIKLGKRYRVRKTNPGKNCTSELTGELIQITDTFYTFKNRNRAESYLKIDFIIGDYQISEVK